MTAENLLAWLGEASLVLGFVVLLVLLARFALRNRISARWRYALWLAVPAALLATLTPAGLIDLKLGPPVATPPSRDWSLQVFYARDALSEAWRQAGERAAQNASPAITPPSTHAGSAVQRGAEAVFDRVRTPAFLVAVWLTGFVGLLLAYAVAEARFRRVVIAHARPPEDGEMAALSAAASGTPFAPARDFRFSAQLAGPAAYGLFRPAVLLPKGFLSDYSTQEQRVMTLHEAEHVRAGHLPQRFAARLLRAVFWFHPLTWIGERSFIADQELAADQGALARDLLIRPQIYAATLIKAIEQIASGEPVPAGGLPLITAKRLKERTLMLTCHASLAGRRDLPAKAALATAGGLALLAGLAGCVSVSAREAASRLAGIAPGATRAAIEATAGAPDFVMPDRNVVVYVSDEGGVPAFVGCTYDSAAGRADVVKFDENDVVDGVWRTPGYFIRIPSGGFEQWTQQRWVSAPETPVRGVIAPGARRADVIAAAGEPYYLMPAYNAAVYVEQTGETSLGCGIGYTPPRGLVIQYDDNGVAARTETFSSRNFAKRLDAWLADETDEASIDADGTLTQTEREELADAAQALGRADGDDQKRRAFRQVAAALGNAGYGETASFRPGAMLFSPSDALAIYSRRDEEGRLADLLVEAAEGPENPVVYAAATGRYRETTNGAVLEMRDGLALSTNGAVTRFESAELPVPDFMIAALATEASLATAPEPALAAAGFFAEARSTFEAVAQANAQTQSDGAPSPLMLDIETQLGESLAAYDHIFADSRLSDDGAVSATLSWGARRSWLRRVPDGVSIFARDIDRNGQLADILVEDLTSPEPVIFMAPSGALSDENGEPALLMHDALVVGNGEMPSTLTFDAYVFPLDDESFELALAAAAQN